MNTSPWHYPARHPTPCGTCYMLPLSFRSAYIHPLTQPDNGNPSDTPQPGSLSHGKHSYYPSSANRYGISPY